MKQRVSRRNGRTAPTQARPIRDLVILTISLIVFLGGTGGLAWALHTQPARGSEAPPATSRQTPNQSSPYTGIIVAGTEEGTSAGNVTGEAAGVPDASATPDAAEIASVSEEHAGEAPETSEAADETATAPVTSPSQETRYGYVVHHTAYREQAVYRTVHHQASTPREVTVGGRTHVEWTSCPVCGQRHASAYNERVVDHVNPVPCVACGGRHDADYDETVYG